MECSEKLIQFENLQFYIRPDFFDENIIQSEVRNYYKIPEGSKYVIDIGAHIGGTAIYAASIGAEVWAFEPEKENFELLKKNTKLNNLEDKIHCINKGVGKKGERKLYLCSQNSGRFSLVKERFSGDPSYQYVPVITLKDAFEEYDIEHCDLMKLDCEGCESEVLSDLSPELLDKIDIIALELHNGGKEIINALRPHYPKTENYGNPNLIWFYK